MVEISASVGVHGLIAFEIGTDSFRKGVATFVAGCPARPSPVSIFLRAGKSLGAVTSRYIFAGQGGDQLFGLATFVATPFLNECVPISNARRPWIPTKASCSTMTLLNHLLNRDFLI